MDNQQGPIVEYMKLCSILRGTWMGGDFGENGYMCIYG